MIQITKRFAYVMLALIALLFIFSFVKACSPPEPKLVKVMVPEVRGTFAPQKPVNHPMAIYPILTNNVKPKKVDTSSNLVDTSNKDNLKKLVAENEALKLAFAKETDSLKKLLAYEKAVQLNNFSTKFEDENMELNIDGVVQGEVKEITPSYKLKERKLDVPVKLKETVLRVYVGGEVGVQTSLEMNKLPLKANLMIQNRKGNIWTGSYDNNGIAWIGFNKSIFKIER
jgi:hypothetical protein